MSKMDRINSFLESLEKWSAAIKNLLEIAAFAFLISVFFSSYIQGWIGKKLLLLSASGVQSVEIAGLKFELQKAKEAVLTVANSTETTRNTKAEDQAPSQKLAAALETVDSAPVFWVYLGQSQNDKIKAPNFTPTNSKQPQKGDTLTASTDTYERDALPIQEGSNWKLGKIVGVVKEGQKIVVNDTKVIEGDNVWLKVSLKS